MCDPALFFTSKWIMVAGHKTSLDKIDHGLIRVSKIKHLFGYVSKLRASKWEKKFRMKKLDPRIHFALNCGTKSCPKIQVYLAKTVYQ